MAALVWALAVALCLGSVVAQPTNSLAGQTPIVNGAVLPDNTFVASTYAQVAAGQAALQSYNDFDLYNFLVNTECLEAEFDSAATFGVPLDPLLQAGGPGAIGARRANISAELLPFLQETARDEAGHVRLIREALGSLASPCPLVDITAFGPYFANAVNLTFGQTFNQTFDPFANDVNLVLAIWSLEEIGATGDKGVAVLLQNATMRDGAAGLAVSAGYQASTQRFILWQNRNVIVQPFGRPVSDIVQAISNYRDALDGPTNVDQGLFYAGGINIVPTDGNGVTFSRTPQQVLSILTFGAADGRGGFFPNGVNGRINLPTPIGPNFSSTRPGTNYTAFSGTGFADPNTVEAPENVTTASKPPAGSQPPASLPASAVAVGQPVPNTPPATASPTTTTNTTNASAPAVAPSPASTSSAPATAPSTGSVGATAPSAGNNTSGAGATAPATTSLPGGVAGATSSAPAPSNAPTPTPTSTSSSGASSSNGASVPAAAPGSGQNATLAPIATGSGSNTSDASATPAPSSTGRKMK